MNHREACATANRPDAKIMMGRMYISEFQSACTRLSLNFTMPPMQMEIDDPDDDDKTEAEAGNAVAIWSQDDLGGGVGDVIPVVAAASCSSAGSAGSAAARAAANEPSMSSQPQQHGLLVMQVDSSESDGEKPRSSGRGRRGSSNRGSEGRGRGRSRSGLGSGANTYSRSFSSFSFRSTSSFGSGDSKRKARDDDGGDDGVIIDDDAASDVASNASASTQNQTQELLSVCTQQRRQLTFKDKKQKQMATLIRSLKRKNLQLEKENKKLKESREEEFAIQKLGKQKEGKASRYSRSSWFAVALRKCMTNVAACDFGLAAMSDISGSTVLRSEVRAAAGLLHTFHSFMAEALSFVVSCRGVSRSDNVSEEAGSEGTILPAGIPEPFAQIEADEAVAAFARLASQRGASDARTRDRAQWSVVACGFRSDATNSNIWRRKKLSVAFCKVVWVHDFDMLQQGKFEEASTQRQCMTPMRH